MGKKRIEWIDFAKGIVIFLVVFGHVNLGLLESPVFESHAVWLSSLYNFFHSFRMPFFFMLSGFLYGYKTVILHFNALKTSLLRKLIALGIPYLLFSVLFWWLKYFMGNNVNQILSWQDLWMIPIKPFEYFWFLYVLLLIFCIVELLDYLFRNDFIVFLLLLCITISGWYFPTHIFFIDKTVNMIIYFYLAKLLQKNPDAIKDKRFILLSIIIFIGFHYCNLFSEEANTGLNFIMAVSITFPIMAVCSQLKTDNRFFHYFARMGKQTLPVYILHEPVASAVRMALLKIGIDNLLVHFVMGIAIAWFVSIYIYRLASKNKYSDFLFYPLKYIKLKPAAG
jgi:fucose 4-O-acetylase-like acetyltransferase